VFLDGRAERAGDRFVSAQCTERVALPAESLQETLGHEPKAMLPRQSRRRQNVSRMPFASPLVCAKGKATGFGGSDRKRIRRASSPLVASRVIGGAALRIREVQIGGAINRVAKYQQLPPQRSRPPV
jgi:hypothetical protein